MSSEVMQHVGEVATRLCDVCEPIQAMSLVGGVVWLCKAHLQIDRRFDEVVGSDRPFKPCT